MRNSLVRIVFGVVVVGGLAALWVIPSYARVPQVQGTMAQPGMSPARVWINNRKADEAIPVMFLGGDPNGQPVPVTVQGVASVSVNGLVEARATRQSWEYRDVTFSPNQAVAAGLNALGSDGWEATGMTSHPNGSVTVLLKRPR